MQTAGRTSPSSHRNPSLAALAAAVFACGTFADVRSAPASAAASDPSTWVRTPIVAGGSAGGTPTDSPALRVDPNTTGSPYAGVVSVNGASGVALTPWHILTARHVVSGGFAMVTVNYGGDVSQLISSASVALQPSAPGSAFPFNDLAIVTLSAPLAAGVPTYDLYRTAPTTGMTLTLVGYGESGSGDVAGYPVPLSSTVKRVGQNNLDLIEIDPAGPDGQGRTAQVYVFDFDGPDSSTNKIGPPLPGNLTLGNNVEAMLGNGDSGGPAFFNDGGVLRVVAIHSFITEFGDGTAYPLFGTGGGGALVFPYIDWIDSIIAPVPEPATVAMMVVFAVPAAGLMLRRRAAVRPNR